MKKIIADKWADALESGKYRQTTGRLCQIKNKKSHYCCLGVLCDILGTKFKTVFDFYFDSENKVKEFGDDDGRIQSAEFLVDSVLKITGIKDAYGKLPKATKYESLASMNDDGKKFPEIAKVIRKYWRSL